MGCLSLRKWGAETEREKRKTIGKERGKEEGGGKRKGRKERRTGWRQAS